jgi:hypothetical protein
MIEGVGLEGIGRVFRLDRWKAFGLEWYGPRSVDWSEMCFLEYSAWTSRDSYQLLRTFEHQPHRVHNDFSTPSVISKQRFLF